MESSGKRTRGPNKQTPWRYDPAAGTSVLRLALDTSDPVQRRRVEAMFETTYRLRRALQRDARSRLRAYWAAHRERKQDAAAVRNRLGLSRNVLERAAYTHLNAAPHLRRFATKALAMHLADSVWAAAERNLFHDAAGKRHGVVKVGGWFDFTRIPGRARSHTTSRKWETFRLHGTLAGHRATYTNRAGDFVQPRRMRPVQSDAWWDYRGPLALVFSGLAEGTLVLPVRLPTAPSNQPMLDHHLADPSAWHKIDLVRRRDPHAVGGWRYEAHLLVQVTPYVSPTVAARRAMVALDASDRVAGIDVNVSNVTIASHEDGGAMRITRIARDAPTRQRDRSRARRERRRKRNLERSRRAMNRAQYQLSKRQQKRARRRADAGLPPVDVIPMGPRLARADRVPLQSYRRDQLSASFRRTRAALAADAASTVQARRDHARRIAADVVRTHGYTLIVEDCRITSWSRSWGRAVAAFSPGTLITSIDREARAVAALAASSMGGVARVATHSTALSQHCPCGQRVPKRLADRVHDCPRCGLRGDRDAVSAVLASFVNHDDARVEYDRAAAALPAIRRVLQAPFSGWQDTLSESTDLSARDGSFVAWSMSTPDAAVAVARRIVGMATHPTLNETGIRQTTSDRAHWRTNMSRDLHGHLYGTPLSRDHRGVPSAQSWRIVPSGRCSDCKSPLAYQAR